MSDQLDRHAPESTGGWKSCFWPCLVVVLLVGQASLILLMVYVATSDGSFAVEPDYYQKGLHWDDIAAQRHRDLELGWRVKFTLDDEVDEFGRRKIRCLLTDRDRKPLNDAVVDLIAFPHSVGSERMSAVMTPDGDGVYAAELKFRRKGVWELRLVVRRGADTFTHTVQQDVFPPGESRPWQPW